MQDSLGDSWASTIGEVAECRAVAELLLRGHKVARPSIDNDAIDLVIDYRLRAQVKCTTQANWRGSFSFTLRTGTRPSLAGHIDVVIFHALDPQLWWLALAPDLDG